MIGWRRPQPPARWLVLDVETSGLDPRRDRLLALAAVALRPEGDRLVLVPADSFEAVLRQPEAAPDKANILVHGLGVGTQRAGVPAGEALAAFEHWAAGAPLAGYHVAFDLAVLGRAMQAALGRRPSASGLDLADLAPVLCVDLRARSLDEWLAVFGIPLARRHQAAADALATAALLQCLWPRARAQGARDFAGLRKLAAARRWIG